jgi:acyl dehydratase
MKGLVVGQRATVCRAFSAGEIAAYRALTGDAGLRFGPPSAGLAEALVPGPLLGGLFSYLLGTRLPGPGSKWLKLHLFFPAPAFAGEPITAEVEIIRLRPEKALVNLRATCVNPAGDIVCQGEALVLVNELADNTAQGGAYGVIASSE